MSETRNINETSKNYNVFENAPVKDKGLFLIEDLLKITYPETGEVLYEGRA